MSRRSRLVPLLSLLFFFQAEDGIRDYKVTGVQTCALPISGFFGRMLSVRGEFGYWVFEGDLQPAQRPSWNYRAEDGGGIILDMMCHWQIGRASCRERV